MRRISKYANFKFGTKVVLHNDVYDTHVSGILISSSSEEAESQWCLPGGTHTIEMENGKRYRNNGYLTHA